jgi:hypothetical protein
MLRPLLSSERSSVHESRKWKGKDDEAIGFAWGLIDLQSSYLDLSR